MTNSNTPVCCGIFSRQPEWAVCKATAENWKQAVLWEVLWWKHEAARKRKKISPSSPFTNCRAQGNRAEPAGLWYHDKAVQWSQQASNPNWPSKKKTQTVKLAACCKDGALPDMPWPPWGAGAAGGWKRVRQTVGQSWNNWITCIPQGKQGSSQL